MSVHLSFKANPSVNVSFAKSPEVIIGINSRPLPTQDKSIVPTTAVQYVRADIGYSLGTVKVDKIPDYYGRIKYDGSALYVY